MDVRLRLRLDDDLVAMDDPRFFGEAEEEDDGVGVFFFSLLEDELLDRVLREAEAEADDRRVEGTGLRRAEAGGGDILSSSVGFAAVFCCAAEPARHPGTV
jgi:hypothetical protein